MPDAAALSHAPASSPSPGTTHDARRAHDAGAEHEHAASTHAAPDPSHTDDHHPFAHLSTLVTRAVAGERDAQERLWLVARPWVIALVLAHKPRDVDADDIVQDVATSFTRSIGSLEHTRAFSGWIRTIALNAARTAARTSARRRPPSLHADRPHSHASAAAPASSVAPDPADVSVPSAEFPDQRARAAEDRRHLLARVDELPEQYREPLLLRAAHGLTSAQIASMLGLTPAAVETRITRARRMLMQDS